MSADEKERKPVPAVDPALSPPPPLSLSTKVQSPMKSEHVGPTIDEIF